MTHLTLLFDRYYKKNERVETGIVLENLQDSKHESLLYLSTGIFENTKKVSLQVEFSKSLRPINAQLSYFKNYFQPYPTYIKDLVYDYENNRLKFTEDFPKKTQNI